MSDSESLKNGVTPNVALSVGNVITMNNPSATNFKQSDDTIAEYVSTKNVQLSVRSTTNDDETTTNPVGKSQSQKANSVKHLSQTQVTHNPTSSMDPTVSNQSQNPKSGKRVIRKIMVIDPKKLQQAGLDRKLAEAIGRHKLKALAKEQKKHIQDRHSHKLQLNDGSKSSNKPTQTEISSLTTTSTQAVVPATVTKTYGATSSSTPNTTNSTQQKFPAIKPLQSLKNCLLVPSTSSTNNATSINSKITSATGKWELHNS